MGFCHLSFYELESGEKIHNLVVDSLDIMCHFYFVGKDSIFINCKNLYYEKELQTPQALRLIDWDGNVKKIYGYDVDQTELRDYKYDINKLIYETETDSQGLPWWSSGWDSMLPMQGA